MFSLSCSHLRHAWDGLPCAVSGRRPALFVCVWLSSGLSTILGRGGDFFPDCSFPTALQLHHPHKSGTGEHIDLFLGLPFRLTGPFLFWDGLNQCCSVRHAHSSRVWRRRSSLLGLLGSASPFQCENQLECLNFPKPRPILGEVYVFK